MIPTELNTRDTVAIPISRKKLLTAAFGSLLFVAIGLWMAIAAPTGDGPGGIFRDPMVVRIVGIVCVVFFSLIGIFSLIKSFSKKIGLLIDHNGITDNSSAVPGGFIPWTDIKGVSVHKIFRQAFLVIHVKNPETYINRHTGMKRRMAKSNHKMTGSPVNIASNGLQIKFDELKTLLERRHRQAMS